MRKILQQKKYTQVPMLSSSHAIDLKESMSIINPRSNGCKKALLIGINYVGQKGELRGCVNDVKTMRTFLEKHCGFQDKDMRVLEDTSSVPQNIPNSKNILEGFRWLVAGAKDGDTLFCHYSGHGGQVKDLNGDEADGMDETIIPVDYQSAGQMTDDVLYLSLVLPLPKGCYLSVVMDCCHSGTVLDLPFVFKANVQTMTQVTTGAINPTMSINPNFNVAQALKLAAELFQAYQHGGADNVVKVGMGMVGSILNRHL
jgi:hypothetical protein